MVNDISGNAMVGKLLQIATDHDDDTHVRVAALNGLVEITVTTLKIEHDAHVAILGKQKEG